MLTQVVLALAFANVVSAACAYPYAALLGALRIPGGRKIFGAGLLTLREPAPTRLPVAPGELADLLTSMD